MEFVNEWWLAVQDSLFASWDSLSVFFPRIAGAAVIAIVGWLIVWLVVYVLDQILRAVRLQKIFDESRFEMIVKKWGSKHDSTGLIVAAVKWILSVSVFFAALSVLDLPSVKNFTSLILTYSGQAVSAAAILLVGFILASFLAMVVKGAIVAAELEFSALASSVVGLSIQILTVIIVLRELGLTDQQLNIAYIGLVAFMAIAGGLSFGLGSQKSAEKAVESLMKKINE